MINRRNLLKAISALGMAAPHVSPVSAQDDTASRIDARRKGVMVMNRIGPSASELYIAKADGTGERKLLQNSVFEHNASFAPDGNSVLFTSERNGAGQSDVFRARVDGTGIEPVATGPAVEDQAALSPDGTRVAFISTREGYRANVWVLDLEDGVTRNLTGAQDVQGDPSGPNGFFRPAWSPDNQWLAFSSDRNTDWRGHEDGHGWEHTQELSVYVIRADGQVFRRIASKPGYCLDRTKTRSTGCPATRQANSRSPGKDGPRHRTVATRGYSFREGQQLAWS
jgi:Tol biopolymer transport system component